MTHACKGVLLAGAILFSAATLSAGDWAQFRGPTGCGTTDAANLPLQWDAAANLNVVWKAELPFNSGVSPSSPVVCGDRVFVTTALDKPKTDHHVIAYSRADGKQLWIATVKPGAWNKIDKRAGNAAPTPCTDGTALYAIFGSGVIVALDVANGKELWRHELETNDFDCAMGGSPVLLGQAVIYVADRKKGVMSTAMAWDKTTGRLLWQVERPDCIYAHSTPVVRTVEGRQQLLVAASVGLQGLDPSSGKVLWLAKGGQGESASPCVVGDSAYYDSGRGGGGAVVRLGLLGGDKAVLAKVALKSDVGSPVVTAGKIFRNAKELVQVADYETGKVLGKATLKGINPWASPIATADRVYYISAGKSYCLKADASLEILGQGDLGDDNSASPAVADGKIFIKGVKYLWCIGEK